MLSLSSLCLRHPGATVACAALLVALGGAGAARLESVAGYRAFLGAGHPAIRELDAFVATFGGGLPIAAVWSCEESPCESVFDAGSLAMAHEVAAAVARAPGVRRVDGPATSPLLVPVTLGLPEVRRLAPEGEPARDIDELAARARSDPLWAGQIVSADGRAGALLVHLEDSESEAGAAALAALRERLARHEAAGFRFHLVGGPVEFVVAGAELERASAAMIPVLVGIVALVIVALFRSWLLAAVSLLCVGSAVVGTLGLMGWLGWPQNSLSQALPLLVLVIGVCDAMHLLASFARRAASLPRDDAEARTGALLDAVGEVGTPCLLTTLTTAAGFAAFAVSELESLRRFGWAAAAGVCAALVACFTLLPVIVARVPLRLAAPARSAAAWERALGALADGARRRSTAVLAVAAACAALGALGFAHLRVDASFEDLYGRDSQVVRWAEAASRHLRAPETLEIGLFPPDGDDGAGAAEARRAIARLESLEQLEGLSAPLSILTPLRELHALVHRQPLRLDGTPESEERTRSLLRLLRFEDPELVELFVSRDGAHRVSFQSRKLPQDELRAVLADVDARVAEALPEGWSARVTGPLAVVGRMIDAIRRDQLESFSLAGLLVLALLAAFFRSLPLAGLALLPTALPVLVTLGAMGLAGIALDVGSAMVAAVLLGLAVDDVVHVLMAYRRRRAAGEDPGEAASAAVREVGRALVTSSLSLAAGFVALSMAPWRSIASFGAIGAVAILAALASVLAVLPALLARVGTARAPRSR